MARKGRLDRGLLSRKDARGKRLWYVRLYHEGKERRFGSFKTKTDARDFYEKAKQEQKAGQFFPERYHVGASINLLDFIEKYMKYNSKKTVKDDWCYARFWIDRLGTFTLKGITPSEIENVKSELVSKGLSNQTIAHYLKFLRHLFNLAIRDGKLERNPLAQIEFPKLTRGHLRYLSLEEEKKLCEVIGFPYIQWIRFAILTGLRQREQFTLKWIHVDLERSLLALPNTKSGHVQYVRLSSEARSILQSFNSWQESQWVFPSQNPGTHLNPLNFYHRIYIPAVKKSGLADVTWHTLRHTFASRLAMSGASEREIAEALRHSGTALVKRYAHLSPTHLEGVMEQVSAFGKPESQEKSVDATVTGTGIEENTGKMNDTQVVENIGAGEEIRTPDQRLGKPMRYHCATPAHSKKSHTYECGVKAELNGIG